MLKHSGRPTMISWAQVGLAAVLWLAIAGGSNMATAATTPSYLTLSQQPSIYGFKSIAPNLFMLLDDSGSMQWDYLGSRSTDITYFAYGYPMGTAEPYGGATYSSPVPGFGASNIYAAQYRNAYVNPNYYNPSVTYTPWACWAAYPEYQTETNVGAPINNFSCHWDGAQSLWVLNNADPTQAYLNPGKTSQGYRDLSVWNDSTNSQQKASGNGFAGTSSTEWVLGASQAGSDCYYIGNGYICYGTFGFWPATYFDYFGPRPGSSSNYTNIANYERVQICPANPPDKPNTSVPVCTRPPALPSSPKPYHTYMDGNDYVYIEADGTELRRSYSEEMQNFANWFQYDRSHILASDSGIGSAFMQLPTTFRVDFGVLSKVSENNFSGQTGIISKQDFNTTNRSDFLQKLYNQNIPPNGTPSREALYNLGEWFANTPNGNPPWASSSAEKQASGQEDLSCRANYALFMTDGQWNGSSPDVENQDGTAGKALSGPGGQSYQYQPSAPYEDSVSNTFADVAMKFWKSDIQSGMTNNVPTNSQDPAFWQHMVTFTVGLGVEPSLVQQYQQNNPGVSEAAAQQAVYQELLAGQLQWPNPFNSSGAKIDDLWHAAIDGHGTYASASDPTALAKALKNALINIVNRTGASTSLAVSTEKAGEQKTATYVYQALFHPQNWWGDLLAIPVLLQNNTLVLGTPTWSSNCVLTGGVCTETGSSVKTSAEAPSTRQILTWNGSGGVPFEWADLTSTEKSDLNDNSKLLTYLRGNRTDEQANGGTLRTRTSVQGDIVRSSPIFVGAPDNNYPNVWSNTLYPNQSQPENSGTQTYSQFEQAEVGRMHMVYVGANDGMLHAFEAGAGPTLTNNDGLERLAYVPESVYPNLAEYASPAYTHHYYVNATPGTGDLFYGGEWHTWLVGGDGGGGNGVFALNITHPSNFSQSNASSLVLGEWDSGNITCANVANCGNDLGNVYGQPVITKFNNGEWGFVFGNGYNSKSGVASIFIGLVGSAGNVTFYELKTGDGPGNDPTNQNRPDGIAFVTPVDLNGDHTADYIYAGDYFGNVWRFNVTSSNPGNWGGSQGNGVRQLFQAVNASGVAQPITTKLTVVSVPSRSGKPRVLVEFGTGTDVAKSDQAPNLTAAGVQSIYGIWDGNFTQWNTENPTSFQYATDNHTVVRSDLEQQSISQEVQVSTSTGGTTNNRIITNNPVCWADSTSCSSGNDQYGWYLDLISPTAGRQGEKVIYNPTVRDGVLIVNTTIPTNASGLTCQAQVQSGWTMALDPATGGRLTFEPFDTRDNGAFDTVNGLNTSGIALGAVGTPSFVSHKNQTYMVVNTSNGNAQIARINLNNGHLAVQLMWKEIR